MNLFLFLLFFVHYVPSLLANPIIGGFIDQTHLHKHHVSFHKFLEKKSTPEYFCGGSIIQERYILTAGHCFMAKAKGVIIGIITCRGIQVIAGTNKRNGQGIRRDVIRVLMPTAYNERDVIYGDVAVAQLRANLGVAENSNVMQIMPIFPLSLIQGVYVPARYCGFGRDTLVRGTNGILRPKDSFSEISKCLDVIILPRAQCFWHDELICAKSVQKVGIHTSCLGDSGSGLIHNNRVVGVLSQGTEHCNTNDIPSVFTRLSLYSEFIVRALDERGSRADMYVLEPQPAEVHPPSARVWRVSRTSRANNPYTSHYNLPFFYLPSRPL